MDLFEGREDLSIRGQVLKQERDTFERAQISYNSELEESRFWEERDFL